MKRYVAVMSDIMWRRGAYIGLRGQGVMDGVSYTVMLIPLEPDTQTAKHILIHCIFLYPNTAMVHIPSHPNILILNLATWGTSLTPHPFESYNSNLSISYHQQLPTTHLIHISRKSI